MLIIAGFLFMIAVFVFVGGFSGALSWLLDIPSAVIVLVPLIFFLIVSKSGKIIAGYMAASFRKDSTLAKTELKALSRAARNTSRFILGVGGFAFLAGIIASLGNIGDMERLGPNLGVSLTTVLYSLSLSFFVFFPVEAWAENKKNL